MWLVMQLSGAAKLLDGWIIIEFVYFQVWKVLKEGRKKERGEWIKYLLIRWKEWPFPLWEKFEDMKESEKKAYAVFKESPQKRGRKQMESTTDVITLGSGDEDDGGVESHRNIETSVFHKEYNPLYLHLTTLTVGRSTRLYEVGIASCLNRGRQQREASFQETVKYVDMQYRYMGKGREKLREKSGLSKSDFYGNIGQKWIADANIFLEGRLIRKVMTFLCRNVRSGEPLWITLNSDSLALLRKKIKTYQPENKDWSWVVGGFTTWNRIQKIFRLVDMDGAQDTRSLKDYQEQELRLDHVSSTTRDVALNMATTIETIATKHFLKKDMEKQFIRRNLEKNWKFFANKTCLEGSKLPVYRGPKSYHRKVELWDKFHGTFFTWTWDDLEEMKKVVKRGTDLLPDKAERKKVLPTTKWNLINEGRHAICPFDNCGQVQRIWDKTGSVDRSRGLGAHMERDHKNESVRQRLCQVRDCKAILSISDLASHAAKHSTTEYIMFWVIDKATKEVTCPECPDLRHLNRFNMLRHMKDKHGWSEWKNPPGGPPLCWLCEEGVPLVDLNKHLHDHELKTNFLMD